MPRIARPIVDIPQHIEEVAPGHPALRRASTVASSAGTGRALRR